MSNKLTVVGSVVLVESVETPNSPPDHESILKSNNIESIYEYITL